MYVHVYNYTHYNNIASMLFIKIYQEVCVEDQLIKASTVGDRETVVSLLQLGVKPDYTDEVNQLINCVGHRSFHAEYSYICVKFFKH